MAVQGPFAVDCSTVFPHGVGIVGMVTPQADFEASTRENRVQARDKDTGQPVWVVDVMDFDPEARERTFKVKISADVQPVPPAAVEGVPVRPVHLDGLTVTPYQKEVGNGRQRISYSLRATGLSEPRFGAAKQSTSSSGSAAGSAGKAA